jgi:pimeloyl-ACP methyl ester carboxylesterase
VNVDTHVQDIVNVLLWEDLNSVVLCGHSYGGVVITAVADRLPDRIASLVYIDAIIPENGKAVIDQVRPDMREHVRSYAKTAGGLAYANFEGNPWRVNENDLAWVNAMCTPQPVACLEQVVTITGVHKRVGQRIFIYASCAEGRGDTHIRDTYLKFVGEPNCSVHTIADSGHEIMVDQPEALANVLMATSAAGADGVLRRASSLDLAYCQGVAGAPA